MVFYSDREPEWLEVLLQCLSFAIQPNHSLDYYLEGIFTGHGPNGGDPGWALTRTTENGKIKFDAYIHPEFSHATEAIYDEATVKFHVHRALTNFAKKHPDRATEAQAIIQRYAC